MGVEAIVPIFLPVSSIDLLLGLRQLRFGRDERLPSKKRGGNLKCFVERHLRDLSPEISPSVVPKLYRPRSNASAPSHTGGPLPRLIYTNLVLVTLLACQIRRTPFLEAEAKQSWRKSAIQDAKVSNYFRVATIRPEWAPTHGTSTGSALSVHLARSTRS